MIFLIDQNILKFLAIIVKQYVLGVKTWGILMNHSYMFKGHPTFQDEHFNTKVFFQSCQSPCNEAFQQLYKVFRITF